MEETRPRVIVTRKWPAEVEAELCVHYDVILNDSDKPMTQQELRVALGSADAVLPTVTDSMPASVLNSEPLRARFLGNYGVGFNHIDLAAAAARGITVTNTPDVLTDCTADLAMALILATARRAVEGDRQIRNRQWTGWRPTHMVGTKVSGKTLGLIGMGRIACAVARRAYFGFGMRILYCSPRAPAAETISGLDANRCSLEELLQESDFVSIHCPANDDTYHLISGSELALMGPNAILVNTARGEVVDSDALIDALRERKITAAGLDVYEGEPNLNEGFMNLENAVLLPHLGSATVETRVAMGYRVLENMRAFFAGRPPRDKLV